MVSALLIEGIHDALGLARQDIRAFIDGVEERLQSIQLDLERRVGAVLGSGNSDSECADSIIEIARAPGDHETNRSLIRFIGSVIGTLWGGQIAFAGLNATTGLIAIGFGVELAPVLAILLGLLIMFFCGRYCLGVMAELLGRLSSFGPSLSN